MPVIENFAAFIAGGGLVCAPGKAKIEYSVSDEPGLFVECRQSAKSVPVWVHRSKGSLGTNVYRRLGNVRELSLPQARKLVQQTKAANLLAVKSNTVAPVPMTLNELMRLHYLPHVSLHLRSAKKLEQLYRLHIAPRFKEVGLADLSRRDVQVFHGELLKKGQSPASADHSIKLLRAACNWAVRADYLEKNPLAGIQLFMVDNQVENYLDEEQLQRLLHVLRTDKNRMVCHILLFLLSTGARLNEALTATWKNVNVESGVWKVDATVSKSKRPRSIPLNDSALWVLEQLTTKGSSEFLFPSPVTGKPYWAITRAWYRLRKVANVQIRIHDLRHTYASLLVSGGRSLFEVQQILGHSDPKLTMRYAHLSAKALKDAANAGSVIVRQPMLQAA